MYKNIYLIKTSEINDPQKKKKKKKCIDEVLSCSSIYYFTACCPAVMKVETSNSILRIKH